MRDAWRKSHPNRYIFPHTNRLMLVINMDKLCLLERPDLADSSCGLKLGSHSSCPVRGLQDPPLGLVELERGKFEQDCSIKRGII